MKTYLDALSQEQRDALAREIAECLWVGIQNEYGDVIRGLHAVRGVIAEGIIYAEGSRVRNPDGSVTQTREGFAPHLAPLLGRVCDVLGERLDEVEGGE